MVIAAALGVRDKAGKVLPVADFYPPFPITPKTVTPPIVQQRPQTIEYQESLIRLWVMGSNMILEKGQRN